jgi:hypothetical protein
MYMGLYRTLRKEDGSPVDKSDDDKAEFFRYLASEMYEHIPGKSFENRKGLGDAFVLYSEAPEYYLNNVWHNWWNLREVED